MLNILVQAGFPQAAPQRCCPALQCKPPGRPALAETHINACCNLAGEQPCSDWPTSLLERKTLAYSREHCTTLGIPARMLE